MQIGMWLWNGREKGVEAFVAFYPTQEVSSRGEVAGREEVTNKQIDMANLLQNH